MFYELSIALSSAIISIVLVFGFLKYFQNDRYNDDDDIKIEYDKRSDLDGKELLLVNVVRL